MENEIKNEMNEGTSPKKKSTLTFVGIAAAVLLVLIIVVFAVVNSPKFLMGVLIANTPDAVTDFLKAGTDEEPMYLTESHQSETTISMNGEDFGFDGDIEAKIMSAYQNDTGDLAAEVEVGLGDLDAITGGLYLSGSEVALISSVLADKYIVDLESAAELGKDTTLEERIKGLLVSDEDGELTDLMNRVKDKMLELRKFALKELPRATLEKGKEKIEIFGEDKNMAYVEVAMDEDYFKDWAEIVLEKLADDDELEDLIVEIAEYLNDGILADDPIDTDEIDLKDAMDDMLDELDDVEVEVTVRIYRDGFTPVAYEVSYQDDYSEGEAFVLFYLSGDNYHGALDADFDGEKAYYNFYNNGKEIVMAYEMEDMTYDLTYTQTDKGVYEIEGSYDYGYMGRGDIEGEMTESKNLTTLEMTVKSEDDYGMDMKTTVEFTMEIDGDITAMDGEIKIADAGEDVAKITLQSETEEVKKNKEYATEGSIKIYDVYSDMEYKIDFENSLIYGEDAEAKLPSWSKKDDVYAGISDMEALEDLFDKLSEDAANGFEELYSVIVYGGIY
ncbi:MAG: hypothetical protein JXN65_11485 [Clostridia bacterium]|nr:hypothetical protein [Clostridia bacterium]